MKDYPITINFDIHEVVGIAHIAEDKIKDIDFEKWTFSPSYIKNKDGRTELVSISLVREAVKE